MREGSFWAVQEGEDEEEAQGAVSGWGIGMLYPISI
jgi:hypothetical protein